MAEKKKPSRNDQTERKLEFVRSRVHSRWTNGQIKTAFAEEFKTTPRAAERFITDIWQEIRKELERPPIDHKADSYAFWTGLVTDQTAPLKERMRAQENLDRVLGNHAPVKQAATDINGKDVMPERRLTIAELDAELDKLDNDSEEPPCVASPQ